VKGGFEFILVDATTLSKTLAFDHEKLAAAISSSAPLSTDGSEGNYYKFRADGTHTVGSRRIANITSIRGSVWIFHRSRSCGARKIKKS
jgi:hypothetical protein